MEDTHCGANCPWVKSGFCNKLEECPNHIESWWVSKEGETKLVKDCVPKRLMLQMQALLTRFEGVQGAAEEARNETHLMRGHFTSLVEATKLAIEEQNQRHIIESTKILLEKKD